MIPFELARKLKIVGWSKDLKWGTYGTIDDGEQFPTPDLLELIFACGSRFRHLSRYERIGEGVVWKASAVDHGENVITENKDPLEAVGYLYIALNKPEPSIPVHYPEN